MHKHTLGICNSNSDYVALTLGNNQGQAQAVKDRSMYRSTVLVNTIGLIFQHSHRLPKMVKFIVYKRKIHANTLLVGDIP